jgi:microcystin-dependent protein
VTEPTTVNVALVIPNTGDLVDLWGAQAVNPNMTAVDGFQGGVQTVSVSNAPITLTSPVGFTPTPSAGPTQSQNAVLRFTGTLTGAVQITLPLPGYYIIEHLASGNFVLSFRAVGSGEIIGFPPGEIQHVYCDGTNVRFCNLGRIGHTEMWAGLTALPAWVTACTKRPYLICDGTVFNISSYPFLGAQLGSQFGGDGVTTFGLPDSRGRVQLPYDGTGTRITAGGCGINGQTIGASLDSQVITLAAGQIPTISFSGSILSGTVVPGGLGQFVLGSGTIVGTGSSGTGNIGAVSVGGTFGGSSSASITGGSVSGSSTNTGPGIHNNVQPSQVTGISVIRAA